MAGEVIEHLEAFLRASAAGLAWVAELCGTLVVGIAVIRAMVTLIWTTLRPGPDGEHVRLDLGRALALGLEFLLAADILNTAVSPSWDQIGRLAAIAAIRTALNIFLQREIESARRKEIEYAGSSRR